MHLADFLREQLRLTGTHLGCEHGVCGACTVLVDGAAGALLHHLRGGLRRRSRCAPSRASTTTRDGELRAAFSREHALQCGFCTPGMLVAARDIVLRLPDADERRIRVELSGNLCRCTGYVGIVRAIRDVIEQWRGRASTALRRRASGLRSQASAAAERFTPPKRQRPSSRRAAR